MPLVVCAILGIFGAVWVWRRPRRLITALLLSAVLVEVIHHWYAGIGQYFPFVEIWIVGVGSAGTAVWKEWLKFLQTQWQWLLVFVIYFVGLLVSTAVGIDRSVSMRYALGVPAVLFAALVVYPWAVSKRYASLASVLRVLATTGFVFVVTAGVAALGFHSGFPVPVGHHIILAWQWPFANKNTFGMLETFALPAGAFLTVRKGEGKKAQILWGIVSVVLLVGVALSYSRSSWIASLIGLLAFVILYYGKKGFFWMVGAFIVLGAALVAKTGLHKWQLLWSKGLDGRLVLWRAGLRALEHHWIWGVGPGNSPVALRPFVPAIYAGLTPSDSILRTAVELGLFGLILWIVIVGVAMLGLLFRKAWRSWDDSALFAILLASLAQQVVESLMLGGVSFGDFFFTLLMGLAWYRVWQNKWPPVGDR